MWIFGIKGASGFSASSTAKEVARGIDASGLTAIVTAVPVTGLWYREGIRFDKDKINDSSSYIDFFAHGQSKLANILHANELARRLKEEGVEITANSLHLGAIATNLLRHHGIIEGVVNWIGKYFVKNIPQGAATTCYVALHPQVKGVSGRYFADSNIATPSQFASDVELAKKLWDFSLDLTWAK